MPAQMPITCSRLTVNRSAYMWMLWMPRSESRCISSTIFCGERSADAVLIADVLDAVLAACRAAAAGDDEGERPLDHRHALLVQRQQLVQRHRQIVQVGDERPVRVDDDLARRRARPARRCAGVWARLPHRWRHGMSVSARLGEHLRHAAGCWGSCLRSVSSSSRSVISGSPRRMKSSAGKGRIVSRVSGVTWVPKAIVLRPAPSPGRRRTCRCASVGAVTWVR